MSRPSIQSSSSARLRKLALPIAAVAITAGATNAFGGLTLTEIPLATGTYTENEARAVSPDGRWVAGFDGATSFQAAVFKLHHQCQRGLRV